MYQANRRQGSKRTRNRSEGGWLHSARCIARRARGTLALALAVRGCVVGGGHIHALRPRRFGYRMPRKALRAATRMALAAKVRDSEMVVIDELKFEAPRTKGHGCDSRIASTGRGSDAGGH